MKRIYTLFAILVMFLISCKKETTTTENAPELPEPSAASSFTFNTDNKTYTLKFKGHKLEVKDTARIRLHAILPELDISLDAKTAQHVNGVGEYELLCCDNDIFERLFSTTQTHWEGEGGGIPGTTKQQGFVKITRNDTKGYEGNYSLIAKSNSVIKEFKGTFIVVY